VQLGLQLDSWGLHLKRTDGTGLAIHMQDVEYQRVEVHLATIGSHDF
jgi:hypothetical protein